MNSDSNQEILHEFPPFLRVYKDGRVERFILTQNVPPGSDPETGAESKDVIISSDPNIQARIFRPKMDAEKPKKLPLLVHYHGGGFCAGSAFGPITKFSMNRFVTYADAIAISIDYRLPPENPLPIAYEDSWAGLKWIAAHSKGSGPDPWLNEYVDFDRVFLGGESAGANIAHDVAIQASVNPLEGVNIVGLILIHPYFANEEPDKLIRFLYPTSSGTRDDPRLNPGSDPRLEKLVCKKVWVCVAEKDSLRERGVVYYETLRKIGWSGVVELIETKEEGHCFHLFNPTSEKAKNFLQQLAYFMNESKY